MAKFNPNVREASDFKVVPGNWLCVVRRSVKLGDTAKPGIEISKTAKGHEMWKLLVEITPDPTTPDAPVGIHFYENLVWDGGPGEGRVVALMRNLGHPVDAWKKSATPVDITPELIYDHTFVMRLKKRYYGKKTKSGEVIWAEALEADGFMPYAPATTTRGALPDNVPFPKTPPTLNKGGDVPGGDASFGFGANAGAPAAPAAKAPTDFGWGT